MRKIDGRPSFNVETGDSFAFLTLELRSRGAQYRILPSAQFGDAF